MIDSKCISQCICLLFFAFYIFFSCIFVIFFFIYLYVIVSVSFLVQCSLFMPLIMVERYSTVGGIRSYRISS